MRKLRTALLILLMTAGTIGATSGSASAAASMTIDPNAWVEGHPYGTLTVSGTATCSLPSGTATVQVFAFQIVMNMANDWGTTTISCADQPAYWSITFSPYLDCPWQFRQYNCFLEGSIASVYTTLTRNGVEEVAGPLQVVNT